MLDADSSQRSAIDAVLSGRSLVIHGPPGTGKSQTIANLIAALVPGAAGTVRRREARRHRRRALPAEERRPGRGGARHPRGHQGPAADRPHPRRDPGPGPADGGPGGRRPDRRLLDRQRRLSEHVAGCTRHTSRGAYTVPDPVGAAWHTGTGAHPGAACRPRADHRDRADRIRDELREFAHLGGFAIRPASTPWLARGCPPRVGRHACDLAARLSSHSVPMLVHHCRRAARGDRAAAAGGYPEAAAVILLYASMPDPEHAGRRRVPGWPGAARGGLRGRRGAEFRERQALRKQARALWRPTAGPAAAPTAGPTAAEPSREELAAALTEAAAQLAQWQELSFRRRPARAPLGTRRAAGRPPRWTGSSPRCAATSGRPRGPEPLLDERGRPGDRPETAQAVPAGHGFDRSRLVRCLTSWPAGRPRRTWPRPRSTRPVHHDPGPDPVADRATRPTAAAPGRDPSDFRVRTCSTVREPGPGARRLGAAAPRG